MSGSDPNVKVNDFTPKSETAGPSQVLGTTSQIGTLVDTINWTTFGGTLDTLVPYRNSIRTDQIRAMAGTWSKHGDKLNALSAQFYNEVNAKIIDSWDSTGGGVAAQAVKNYANQLVQIAAVVSGIANSLNFAADFLDVVRTNIPDGQGMLIDGTSTIVTEITDNIDWRRMDTSGGDYAGNYDYYYNAYSNQVHQLMKQAFTKRANDVMNEVFVAGGKSVAAAMPMFPLPQSVTQGLPDPTGKTTNPGPGPGAGPGAGPGLGPGGTPSLTPMSGTGQLQSDLAKQEAAQQAQLQAQEKAQQDAYAKEQAAQQQQQQQQAAQQQQQQQQQQQEQQASQAAQQGLQAAQQAAQQGLQAAQQAAQQLTQPASADLAKDLANGMGLAGMAGSALSGLKGGFGGGGVGGALNNVKGSLLAAEEQASKLFPRAAMVAKAEEAAAEEARAGLASSGGMGSMGGMGAAGRGQQEKEKEKKRAEFLDSEEWLEQVMGEAPLTSKPVVEG
ncbi:hypothetical protein KO481_41635 [Nocardia sp. NEAU-G5]|uniref:PPE family domain-containing protein n=1 Tax=Nocardia albiluteola TaxID=2842303 RepID=A0ABS6BCI9_9NOCA|nr:hypothetical protein [Nocardia albiluteola]MBU3068004.1 hypothetical protein [Nocardia albiluteola]